ncbi:ATP-binding protein [Schinkia azotoformans]|uniref:ATP-binding protein n=1 Tax=Schinkia azotoformans TaxID=1454 RepID=UPI002DBF0F25|nr:ATP-binding protein [Schinkia azotoformans]MEC1723922.1 ATP-binding protein [Schinkia azotoformans]
MQAINFSYLAHKSLRMFIPDLKGLEPEDYESEEIEAICTECGGNTHGGWKYKLQGDNEWREYDSSKDGLCLDCSSRKSFEEEMKQNKIRYRESFMNRYWFIPTDLENAGFKTYERRNNITTNAANTCIAYVKEFQKGKPEERHNLLLMGNPGTGKSHLSVAVARTLREVGFLVGFITTGKLLALIKDTYNRDSDRSENDILEDIKKFDLLVLDDLGAEQGNKDEFSWTRKTLFEIINSRLGKPTIYTTNFNDSNIAEAVGERIASRLYVKSKFIDLFTDDYRKKLRVI